MNIKELKEYWKSEEAIAHIHGWDFSYINGRYTEEIDLPWDYKKIVQANLKAEDNLLDIDTGGGEFLLSLNHLPSKTSATEGYPPNVELCKKVLLPRGIDFKEANDYKSLPFEDETFDIIINRHGSYDVHELYRILKPDGVFITQQVGDDNDRELVELLLPGTPKLFPGANVSEQKQKFLNEGFSVIKAEEAFRPIQFYDVGALVWFARIIEWEFPGFSVDRCFKELLKAQEILDSSGSLKGSIHRYLIAAHKPA